MSWSSIAGPRVGHIRYHLFSGDGDQGRCGRPTLRSDGVEYGAGHRTVVDKGSRGIDGWQR